MDNLMTKIIKSIGFNSDEKIYIYPSKQSTTKCLCCNKQSTPRLVIFEPCGHYCCTKCSDRMADDYTGPVDIIFVCFLCDKNVVNIKYE